MKLANFNTTHYWQHLYPKADATAADFYINEETGCHVVSFFIKNQIKHMVLVYDGIADYACQYGVCCSSMKEVDDYVKQFGDIYETNNKTRN